MSPRSASSAASCASRCGSIEVLPSSSCSFWMERGHRAGANPLHFFAAASNGRVLLANEGRQFSALARSKLVECLYRFFERGQDGRFGDDVRRRMVGCVQYPRQQQDLIQIRMRLDPFLCRSFAKGRHIRAKQRQIEIARGAIVRPQHRTAHVDVPAQNGPFQRGPHQLLQRIQLRAQMKMQIQAAMVDAFQADDHIAVRGAFLDAGEAGHAAHRQGRCFCAQGFTTGSDTHCRSCNR